MPSNRQHRHQEENPPDVDRHINRAHEQPHTEKPHNMILNNWNYLDTESITLPDNPRLEAGARVFAEAVRLAMTVTDSRTVEWVEAAGELCLMLAGVPMGDGLEDVTNDTRVGDDLDDRHDADDRDHVAVHLDQFDAKRGLLSWGLPEWLASHRRTIRRKLRHVVELIRTTHAHDRADGIVSGSIEHRPGSRPSLAALAVTDQAEAAIIDLFATLESLAAAQA